VGHGRSRRQEELRSFGQASVWHSSVFFKRRTALQAWCGVLFFAVLTGCAGTSSEQSLPPKQVLVIGAPEGVVAGTELGVRSLAANFSREGLTRLAPDGRVVPSLAEKWVWEKDGRQLRVTLRADVKAHDGTAVNAPLLARILAEAVRRPAAQAQYSSFGSVKAVRSEDDLHLLIDLSEPSSFLPEDLEVPLEMGPQNGTGPFRIVKVGESEIELRSFEQYYLGAPSIEGIILRPYRTLRTAWTSLLRGDIDMVTNVPPEAVEFVTNDQVQVVSVPRYFQFMLTFNSQKPPFTSPEVRKAMNVAIDREAIIKRVLDGHGTASTGPFWPRHWAYDNSIQPYGYDSNLAESRLDQSGFPMPAASPTKRGQRARFRFTCLVPANFSIWERVALEVQRQLYNVGVDMQFKVVPIEEFDALIRSRNFEAAVIDMISGPTIGRVHNFWRSAKHFQGLNLFGYENPEAERLFSVLRESTNEVAVRSATSRLQRVMMDDPPALFLAWSQGSRAIRREFKVGGEPGVDPLDTIGRWTTVNGPLLKQ
jgi:peptide/nickel transport system substrate-binding protein